MRSNEITHVSCFEDDPIKNLITIQNELNLKNQNQLSSNGEKDRTCGCFGISSLKKICC